MVDDIYKTKVTNLIEKAKTRGKIKKYSEFCKTDDARKYGLSKEAINYYTSKSKGATK